MTNNFSQKEAKALRKREGSHLKEKVTLAGAITQTLASFSILEIKT